MKVKNLRFLSPEENIAVKKKDESTSQPSGYISGTGKLIIPQKAADEVGMSADNAAFKIGVQENKRKLKSLYLVPASGDEEGAFEMKNSGRNNFIALGVILENNGVEFQTNKYTFDIDTFEYEQGVKGYELKLNDPTPKTKRAGRKSKSEA